ncbi:hypothetical protein MG293_007527 [Ovis ammon polii]|uniref:Uncharacterized protein n=1 Tax=Ovis ammon polii TaxID=230172 RepID=A0AAD4U7V4_OVIAM|nr:hypothetical protein MG293_007527 [Ovis ammon polii]
MGMLAGPDNGCTDAFHEGMPLIDIDYMSDESLDICDFLNLVSSSHPGVCRRGNSIPFTFRMKANANDLRKVVELQVICMVPKLETLTKNQTHHCCLIWLGPLGKILLNDVLSCATNYHVGTKTCYILIRIAAKNVGIESDVQPQYMANFLTTFGMI